MENIVKNERQTLLKLMTLLALSFALSACGGGSSTPATQGQGIVVCAGADDGFATATVMEASKVIKGIENNPSIRLWHLSDGTRKACVVAGTVEIL